MSDIQDTLKQLEEKEAQLASSQKQLEDIQSKTAEEEAKLAAMKLERERVLADIAEKRKEKEALNASDKTFQAKFREEQKAKAESKFFSEFKYEDEAKKKELLDTFSRLDSGSVDADNIYTDMVRAHLYLNPDKYISIERQAAKFAGSADEFMKAQSTSAFTGAGNLPTGETVELDELDIKAAQFAGIPIEVYKDLKRRGKV